jgi:hypothetical protein
MKSSRKTGLLAMSFTVLLLVGFGCYRATSELGQNSAEIDKASILAEAKKGGLIMDDQEIERMSAVPLTQITGGKQLDQPSEFSTDWSSWRSGALADVTGGTAFGLAHINSASNQFTIIAQMGGLQMPDENSYYEGWLVRRGDRPGVISLGKAVLVEDRFYVSFTAQENLESHNFFVLTLESNDLNPAPGKHLLEGIIE